MNNDAYVDIVVGGELPQPASNLVLQLEFLNTRGLLREHELHIIYTD
jgi:hypothetical protein